MYIEYKISFTRMEIDSSLNAIQDFLSGTVCVNLRLYKEIEPLGIEMQEQIEL